MSLYKITDPKERRRMFEKLSQTRKNVQEQFLEDKIGKIQSGQSLKNFFKPVTESKRELTNEIKEQLTPLRDKVLTLPSQTLAIQPAAPPLEIQPPLETEELDEELMNVGPIAAEYLEKYIDPEEVDKTLGIYLDKDGTWKIGNEKVDLEGNDLIIVRSWRSRLVPDPVNARHKLEPNWKGPFIIISVSPDSLNYTISDIHN